MKRIFLFSFVLLLFHGCSSEPEVNGSWKNGDGNLLVLNDDGTARLGQEGLSGFAPAKYILIEDTLTVETIPEDTTAPATEEYILVLRSDTLHLEWITRKRPGDVRSTSVDQMSRTIGKPKWKFAFYRISEESVL